MRMHTSFYLLNVIYLFVTVVLGLPCCAQAFFGCGEQGSSLVVAHGLLIVASPSAEYRL